jgi:hypothetical protein
MQVLAVAGIVAAFALVCSLIYLYGRSWQRKGRDLTFVFPRFPDSMQAVQPKLDVPPKGVYPQDDNSLVTDEEP